MAQKAIQAPRLWLRLPYCSRSQNRCAGAGLRPAFPEAAGTVVTWGYSCHLSAHTHWEK